MRRPFVRFFQIGGLAVVTAVAPLCAPNLLAFPFAGQVASHPVYSVVPLSAAIVDAIQAADRRVAAAPSGGFRPPDQQVFLTDGGWRWRWLAGRSHGAFGLTRPVNDAIIVNRLDAAGTGVVNDQPIGGRRSLSGVIAHEMTHGSLRAHFGTAVDWQFPQDLREGYCDYVAAESSLSDADAARLLQSGRHHPGLPYWQGRKRVASAMARPGQTVDSLFATWRE